MVALRKRVGSAALVAVLLASVAAGLTRGSAPSWLAGSGYAAAPQIGSGGEGAACPLVCDADGDGLLDALLIPIALVAIAGLTPFRSCPHREPRALTGRAIPPLPPPPRFRG